MTPHLPVAIAQRAPLDWTVEVAGVDLSTAITGMTLTAEGRGYLPRLELDLRVLHLDRIDLEQAVVMVPASTHEALVTLGWTPPSQDVDGTG